MARAQTQIVERLQRASTGAKLILVLVAALVIGGVYYFFIYSDLDAEYSSKVALRQRLIEQEQQLVKRQTEYRDLLQQKKDVEERLQKNAIKLPESSELPAFFQHLETQAATANVRIVSRALDKEIPVENYIKVPVKLEVQGDFYQINNYFKLLSETTRIITIENLSIGTPQRDPSGHVTLTGKFMASTFRQSDRKAAPPAKPGAPAAPPAPAAAPGTPAPAAPAAPAEGKK
jgi:type IV pilus assembly protein PilO